MKNLYKQYLELINDGIIYKLTPKQKENFLYTMRQEMKEQMFGDRSYFIKNGYIVQLDDAPDIFMSYIKIRKATEEEIAFDKLYWDLYHNRQY